MSAGPGVFLGVYCLAQAWVFLCVARQLRAGTSISAGCNGRRVAPVPSGFVPRSRCSADTLGSASVPWLARFFSVRSERRALRLAVLLQVNGGVS